MNLEYHKPGIYHDMPEAEYHADPSLGSSSLKRLLISPLEYWTYSPWNPRRPDPKATMSQEVGTALHTRMLLGRETFYQRYAANLDPDKYPLHLRTVKQLEKRCMELGASKYGTIAELSAKIRERCQETPLWVDAQARHRQQIGDREELDAEEIERIEAAVLALEKSVEARDRVFGGKSEVSLFWRDPEHGTPLKARLDAWKEPERQVIDLKSFANPRNRDINKAVGWAIRDWRYDIQAVSYLVGLQHLTGHRHEWAWVFIQTGWSPNIRIRTFGESFAGSASPIWALSEKDFRYAVGLWAHWHHRVGMEVPWTDPATVEELDPIDLPYDAYEHAEQEIFV